VATATDGSQKRGTLNTKLPALKRLLLLLKRKGYSLQNNRSNFSLNRTAYGSRLAWPLGFPLNLSSTQGAFVMTTALLLIDLQNDYFPGGSMELVGADNAVAQARTLVHAFRDRKLPIFHIQHIAIQPNATFFLPDTAGANIHAAVQPLPDEAVITKHFPNSFRETVLLEKLRAINISKLIVVGMMTHMCVDTTVRAASDLGFEVVLAQDGCATRALEFTGHRIEAEHVQLAYLAALNGFFAKVLPAQEIIPLITGRA
jgi:nicotinamidase-related amidase